jgi:hypothetical protein
MAAAPEIGAAAIGYLGGSRDFGSGNSRSLWLTRR